MAAGSQSTTSFGVFEIDRRSGELRKAGVRVKLSAQPFQVLIALLDRAGEVVTREELQRQVWPADTFVDFDRGLNKAVNRLREALGDTADSPRFIETVPKRGYRFIAPVQNGGGVSESLPEPPTAGAGMPRRPRRPRQIGLAAAALVSAAAVYAWLSARTAVPEVPSRVVLAGFANHTGDRAFDHTIAQALAVHLQQSPVVQVVSDHEVTRTLALMRQPPDRPLTRQLAHEVCRRTDADAVLDGTLSLVGAEYVLGLDALDCQTGHSLFRRQLKAGRKEDVLAAIDTAGPDVRRVLGESRDSVRRFDTRIHRMLTTGSLDAFEAYTAGERTVLSRGGWSAVPFFRRAIEIDPEFAYAHAALGLVLGTFGEAAASSVHTERAYHLRDRVSEWERFFIAAQYHDRVTGELDKVLTACEVWVETYPHDRTARNRLAAAYNQLGQPARALAELERAREIGREHPIDVDAWATTAMRLNREAEGLALVQPLVEQTPDRLPLRRTAYRLHFIAGDAAAMASQVDWASRTPRAEALFAEHAATHAYGGRVRESRTWLARAVNAAVRNDFNGNAAVWTGLHAVREALLGNAAESRAQARAALELEENWETRALAAVALARVGDLDAARQLAGKVSEERPRATLVQAYWLPVARALGDLHQGNAGAAIESLRPAEPYELSDTRLPLLPAFLRGEAYLLARDGRRAAVEFEKLVHHRGAVGNSVLGVLANLGLARALGMAGDTATARARYASFFESWRGADPETPLLRQAQAEYRAVGPE
jgi:DNA-binding winged helix-turn-helix (wHTH) protein/tetratricopeptide (TPR) repeat protein